VKSCRNLISIFTFKVLSELIETEQKYVKDLQFLLAAYLEPLKKEHFWSYNDLEQLYNNVKEIFVFQTKFLRILEESLESDPGFCSHASLAQFKVLIYLLVVWFCYLRTIPMIRFATYYVSTIILATILTGELWRPVDRAHYNTCFRENYVSALSEKRVSLNLRWLEPSSNNSIELGTSDAYFATRDYRRQLPYHELII
jgi:hypothetical protein